MTIGVISQPFPSCCGATILHSFSTEYTESKYFWTNLKFLEGHVYFGILAAGQQERFKSMLEAADFRCVSDKTVNKNSKNRLYVWVRDPGIPLAPVQPVVKSFFSS